MRKLLVFAGIAGLLMVTVLVPVSFAGQRAPSNLNQARAQGFDCHAVGDGTICQFFLPDVYGPEDSGIVCGSGAGAFDIFDQGIATDSGTVWFDRNGDLTKVKVTINYSFGQWSNPLTGDTVDYTQHNTETTELAVPGDFTSGTVTNTGENIYRIGTAAPVLLSVGRQVFNFDGSELLSNHGPNAFIAAFYEGDPHAFDQVCTALGAS